MPFRSLKVSLERQIHCGIRSIDSTLITYYLKVNVRCLNQKLTWRVQCLSWDGLSSPFLQPKCVSSLGVSEMNDETLPKPGHQGVTQIVGNLGNLGNLWIFTRFFWHSQPPPSTARKFSRMRSMNGRLTVL